MTLEGEKSDWEEIYRRLYRLYELGDETSMWADMLRPILRRFVDAFDGKPDTDFWQHIVYQTTVSCGEPAISGWITAFCLWSPKGKWLVEGKPLGVPTQPRVIPPPVVRPKWKEPADASKRMSLMRASKRLSAALPGLFRKNVQQRATQQSSATDKEAAEPARKDSEPAPSSAEEEDKPKASIVEHGECTSPPGSETVL